MTVHRTAVLARFDATPRQHPVETRLAYEKASWGAAAGVCMIVGLAAASPVVCLAGPPAMAAARYIRERRRQRYERRRADRSVIDLVDRLTQHVRSGGSLAAAVEHELAVVDPSLDELIRPVRTALSSGEGLGSALQRVGADQPVSLDLLLSSVRLLLGNGGPAAMSLDRIGETLRAGVAARDEAAAQAGQATASSILLAVLPMVFAVLVAVIEPSATAFYLTTWTGAGCVIAAGALSFASWWWIDRAVHR